MNTFKDEAFIEDLSQEDHAKTIIQLYLEFSKIESDTKSLQEKKKSLRELAKKKNINLKALDECLKQLKKPKQEREQEVYHLNEYLNILEKVL